MTLIYYFAQTKISKFYVAIFVNQDIIWFQISVNNAVLVQVLQGIHNLERVALYLQFVKSLPPLEQVIKRLILADL